ncbi:MAG: gamma-glutamylcyclotransferase family protein, partial [Chloroflexota bacterium]
PGAVYEIDDACLRALDKYEDYPKDYNRMNVIVFNDFGDAIEAVTYMRTRQLPEGQPGADYIKLVRQGYHDWGLI